jgi:hypothetical protein
VRVAAWRVQDTGLVAAPGPFRRLAGSSVRHLRGTGPVWPVQVVLDLDDRELRVVDAADDRTVVGTWPRSEVTVRRVASGPPVQFVLDLPGQAQLLAAAAEPDTEGFLAALAPVLG